MLSATLLNLDNEGEPILWYPRHIHSSGMAATVMVEARLTGSDE
ncbi:MAG: hypothetical protein AB1810_09215 [Pseudomonadota bacterium]